MKIALAALVALSACTPAVAGESQAGWSHERTCFKSEYREEYIPGTENDPGYVKSWKETVEVPCEDTPTYNSDPHPDVGHHRSSRPSYRRHVTVYEDVDTNDCTDGKIAGALLGGGAGAALSRGDGRWWAIPLGAVVGSHIGCDAAGG
tara:strand:- start:3694 stop:4137 length:444 start_codon:yes stop_codon:yes gene_type:complete